MGVTKQAAQKRFVAAQSQARAAGNNQITPAHLVLGLLVDPDALAVRAIAAQAVDPDKLRQAAVAVLPSAAASVPDLIPFDADSRKALELTFREALRLGHNFVGTEHVLLALLEHENGAGPLSEVGLEKGAVEHSITEMLSALEPEE